MTKIPWTEETWNPVIGCTKIAAGCKNCYAEKMALRLSGIECKKYENVIPAYSLVVNRGRWNNEVICRESELKKPIHWKKPRKIFVCSMSDLFHKKVPFEFIDMVHAVIGLCPQHTIQILTKRIKRTAEYYMTRTAIDDSCRVDRMPQYYNIITDWLDEGNKGILGRNWERCERAAEQTDYTKPLTNLHIGTSISTQEDADKSIPILLQIPAAVRFLSIEPLLERINFNLIPRPQHFHTRPYGWMQYFAKYIHQAIIGCESGPGARLCSLDDIDYVIDQLRAANVPIFLKQIPLNGRCEKDPFKWPVKYQSEDLRQYPK